MKQTFILTALLFVLVGCPPADDDDAETCDLNADQPVTFIDDPDNSLMLEMDDPINWVVRVEDEDGDVENAGLAAFDLSGGSPIAIDFDVPGPNADGRTTFGMPGGTLGTGVVTVRIRATDEQGCVGDDSVVLCIDVPDDECPEL